METKRRFILGVDLDGVCADYQAGLRPIAAQWLGLPLLDLSTEVSVDFPEWGLTDAPGGYEALHRFAVTQRELLLGLRPLEGAPAVLRRLAQIHNIRIRIISQRLCIEDSHKLIVRQTVEWLDRCGIPYWDLCFVCDKVDVNADLYVEDAPEQIEILRRKRRRVIAFSNSTNRHVRGVRADSWCKLEGLILKEVWAWNARNSRLEKGDTTAVSARS